MPALNFVNRGPRTNALIVTRVTLLNRLEPPTTLADFPSSSNDAVEEILKAVDKGAKQAYQLATIFPQKEKFIIDTHNYNSNRMLEEALRDCED